MWLSYFKECLMNTMFESLEGRQMFSIALDTTAPTPVPLPYPNTSVTEAKKTTPTEIVITKKIDKSSPVLM
jgi:hypothetical protein